MHRLIARLKEGWESTSVSRLPWSLRLMGLLFIGYGFWSLGRFVLSVLPGYEGDQSSVSLLGATLSLNFSNYQSVQWEQLFVGLLQINIGTQLWDRDRFWRFVVLAWLACNAAAVIVVGILGFVARSPLAVVSVTYYSTVLWQAPGFSPMGIVVMVLLFALNLLWLRLQWWALDRPEVRKLFIKSSEESELSTSTPAL